MSVVSLSVMAARNDTFVPNKGSASVLLQCLWSMARLLGNQFASQSWLVVAVMMEACNDSDIEVNVSKDCYGR